MKFLRYLLISGLILGMIGFAIPLTAEAQHGYGMHGGMWGGDWSYCPYCGSQLRDRGGYHMGRGYDRRDYGRGWGGYNMGPGMMHDYRGRFGDSEDPGYRQRRDPLNADEAKDRVKEMLERSRNPNLKLGDIEEKKNFYTIDIQTQNGSLVDKIQVDKETGMMRSAYR